MWEARSTFQFCLKCATFSGLPKKIWGSPASSGGSRTLEEKRRLRVLADNFPRPFPSLCVYYSIITQSTILLVDGSLRIKSRTR